MKVVVEVDKKVYEHAKLIDAMGNSSVYAQIIANGTPLPRHHGDLIDRDELKQHSCGGDYDGCGGFTPEYISLSDINDAPVIIPAARITESSETMGDL